MISYNFTRDPDPASDVYAGSFRRRALATRPCRQPDAAGRTAAMRKAMVIVALLAASRLGSGTVVRPSQAGPVAQPRAAKADRLNVKQFSATMIMCDYKTIADKSTKIKLHPH